MFDFYRYVNQSTWLGGQYEYSELNEAAPYWFNYIVPLAWVLDDERLKSQAKAFLDYILDTQAEDGWLGPEKTRQTRGIWGRSLLSFGLTVRMRALLTHSVSLNIVEKTNASCSNMPRLTQQRLTEL